MRKRRYFSMYMAIYGNTQQYMVIHGYTLQYMAIHTNTCGIQSERERERSSLDYLHLLIISDAKAAGFYLSSPEDL